MNVVDLIEGFPLWGVPESVVFGYSGPIDGKRGDDPPEIHQAIMQAGGHQEVEWAVARPALIALGEERAAGMTVQTDSHSVVVQHQNGRWLIVKSGPRLGR